MCNVLLIDNINQNKLNIFNDTTTILNTEIFTRFKKIISKMHVYSTVMLLYFFKIKNDKKIYKFGFSLFRYQIDKKFDCFLKKYSG